MLDLGSGAGTDVLISARRVAPDGMAIGLDMTDEMLELAVRNAVEAGVTNVEFRKGFIEEIPLEDASVDVVISNCVINLSADKAKVLREAARVLRPGGRFAVSDVIADPGMDAATRSDMEQWTGCIAGALTRGGVRARAHRRRASRTWRSTRPTACTSTRAPRSCGRASPALAAFHQVSTDTNADLARRGFELWNERSFDDLLTLFHEDAVWDMSPFGIRTWVPSRVTPACGASSPSGSRRFPTPPSRWRTWSSGASGPLAWCSSSSRGAAGGTPVPFRYAGVGHWRDGRLDFVENHSDLDLARSAFASSAANPAAILDRP